MPVFTLTNGDDTFPTVESNLGNDTINGLDGRDSIDAGLGDDLVDGGAGDDTIFGGNGNDTIVAGLLPLDDVLDGGDDQDRAVLDFEGVQNLATGEDVRIVAAFSTATFSVLIDGIAGTTLANFEELTISSGNGNDRIDGGAGDDVIGSLGGRDRLSGGAGDDRLSKTSGRYDLDGGQGQDTLTVGSTDNGSGTGLVFDARPATGTISSGTGAGSTTGTFRRFEHFVVSGTSEADQIFTGDRDDIVAAGGGDDAVQGGAGDDSLDGGEGDDALEGGAGDDTLNGGTFLGGPAMPADSLFGGGGADRLFVATPIVAGPLTFAGAVFDGGSGNDVLEIQGTTTALDLTGATIAGIEQLLFPVSSSFGIMLTAAQASGLKVLGLGSGFLQIAAPGDTVLDGEVVLSQVRMAAGGHLLDLSGATRTAATFLCQVNGGTGNDTIIGSDLRERIFGGTGNDRIEGNSGPDGFDTVSGGDGNDTIVGGGNGDSLSGDADDDRIDGKGGADGLLGGTGNDDLRGGAGVDVMFGAAGRDTMTGGADADTFVYLFTNESDASAALCDVIRDFTVDPATGAAFLDRIVLQSVDAKTGTSGNDTFTFIGTDAFTAEGQVRVRQDGADTIVELNTSGTGGVEMSIRLVGVAPEAVEAADFIL